MDAHILDLQTIRKPLVNCRIYNVDPSKKNYEIGNRKCSNFTKVDKLNREIDKRCGISPPHLELTSACIIMNIISKINIGKWNDDYKKHPVAKEIKILRIYSNSK